MSNADYLQEVQKKLEEIHRLVIHNMNEGLIVIGNDGKIILTNPRATEILGKDSDEMNGCPFARLFYGDSRNDEFNQAILDAIYNREKVNSNYVTITNGVDVKRVNVITSGLFDGENTIGVIVVLSDVTEFVESKLKNEYAKRALSQYISESVAEKILESPDALNIGGSKEEITILMSDLRGFTAISEEISPDDLVAVLNHYLEIMGKIIKEQHGTIIEYIGDGILAIFGAPITVENHALSAVKCAIKMQQAMEEVNRWNSENRYPHLGMGIGINTGTAIVGNMGSEYTMKYNVIGSSVNLCGRIESYTLDGQIFISSSTRNNIQDELMIDEVRNISPKGMKKSLDIYSVYGIGGIEPLSYSRVIEDPVYLDIPISAKFFKIESKHISEEWVECMITAESENRIVINGINDDSINIFDNVLIRTTSNIYCKVLEKLDKEYLMAITARA